MSPRTRRAQVRPPLKGGVRFVRFVRLTTYQRTLYAFVRFVRLW